MNLDDFSKERLWQMLVETVHTSVMYPTHKAYTRDFILKSNPDITGEELASRLNMSKGEAQVILQELRSDNKNVL